LFHQLQADALPLIFRVNDDVIDQTVVFTVAQSSAGA